MKRWIAISMVAAGLGSVAYAGPRDFIVEHAGSGGDQATAQPLIDKFLRYLEKSCGWPANSATGAFSETPKGAMAAIDEHKPGYGLFDPDLWLFLRKKDDLQVLVTVEGKRQAAGKMHLFVKSDSPAKALTDLKGKKLASNHIQSKQYVSKVIFDGKIDVGTFFTVVDVPTLFKAFKALDRGEADAVLIGEDDLEYLKKENSPYLASAREVFTSAPTPPTPMVAFGKNTTAKDREAVVKALVKMCSDEAGGGADICRQLEITKFALPDKAAFDEAVRRYEK